MPATFRREIGLPYRRAGDTMTNHLDSQQIVVFLAEVSLQTGNLTGSARKQNSSPLLQELSDLLIGITDDTLHILAASKRRNSFYTICPIMDYIPILIESSTKNDSAFANDRLGQRRENTSRRAMCPHILISVSCRINRQRFARLSLMNHRAYFFAQSALGTGIPVSYGIKESLLIGFHCDTANRTCRHTSMTATTFPFVLNVDHRLRSFEIMLTKALPTNIRSSRVQPTK